MWPYRARQGGWGESSRRIFGDFWGNAPLVEVHQLKNQLSQKEFRHKAVIDWANAYLFENKYSGSLRFLFFYQLVAKLCSCYQKIFENQFDGSFFLYKLLVAKLCSCLFSDSDFLEKKTVFNKMCYLSIATLLVRFKYYHAWLLADAICNLSGLGFHGYSACGSCKWDLVSNVDVLQFEVIVMPFLYFPGNFLLSSLDMLYTV